MHCWPRVFTSSQLPLSCRGGWSQNTHLSQVSGFRGTRLGETALAGSGDMYWGPMNVLICGNESIRRYPASDNFYPLGDLKRVFYLLAFAPFCTFGLLQRFQGIIAARLVLADS